MPQTASSEEDRRWMRRALDLAEKSVGLSSPNPAVGCILTQNDRIVGEGFHQYDKLDHAEIVALKQAGDLARDATAYVTLEPCSHRGRTGPCADALLAAGVRRVVIATQDPNPLVHGRGIQRLIAAGIEVGTGVLEGPARRLNDAFARFSRTSLPFVTMKVAASLDGCIAPPRREATSRFSITGEQARSEVHRMRHAADALLTGVGTILADDPLLTDRSGLPRRRPLLRVVLDSTLRTPLDSQIVATAKDDVLIFFAQAGASAQRAFEARGVRLERLERLEQLEPDRTDRAPGRVPLEAALRRLGALEIAGLLVEGGAQINAAVLNEGLADKLTLFYAPIFLGPDAVPMLAAGAGPHAIRHAIELAIQNSGPAIRRFGRDFSIEAYLRDPWLEQTGLEEAGLESTGSSGKFGVR